MRDLVIIGAGDGVKAIVDLVEAIDRDGALWRVSIAPEAIPARQAAPVGGKPDGASATGRLSGEAMAILAPPPNDDATTRPIIVDRLGLDPARYAILVHPSACVSRTATVGPGVVLFDGVVVGPDAVLGAHAVVEAGAVIGHDATVDDGVVIGSSVAVSGSVRIGRGARIGAGARIREGLSIGAGAVVRAGSVVLRNVAAGQTVAGNPAWVLTDQGP